MVSGLYKYYALKFDFSKKVSKKVFSYVTHLLVEIGIAAPSSGKLNQYKAIHFQATMRFPERGRGFEWNARSGRGFRRVYTNGRGVALTSVAGAWLICSCAQVLSGIRCSSCSAASWALFSCLRVTWRHRWSESSGLTRGNTHKSNQTPSLHACGELEKGAF